jgi:hypothetical protein
MKKLIFLFVCFLNAIYMINAQPQNTIVKNRRVNRLIKSGGLVTKINNGPVVQIYDAKQSLPLKVVKKVIFDVQMSTGIAIKYTQNDLGEKGAIATVKVVESDLLGPLSIYPDKFTTVLNINTLRKGTKSDEHFNLRCIKQLWRSLAYALGAGNSNGPFTVMKPFRNMKELDECKVCVAGPEALNVMIKSAKKLGAAEAHTMTYRQACIEGWAPAPTNDIQKAIWDKIHATPKNPMKIKFDPKKGR